MKVVYLNHTILTKKVLSEFYTATFSRVLRAILILLGVICGLIALNALIMFEIPLTILFAVLGLLEFFIPAIIVNINSQRGYIQNTMLNNGSEMCKTTEFSDNIKIQSSNDSQVCFAYNQVTQVCDAKNLIILKIGNPVGIILDKSGFAMGNCDSFKEFIKSKCSDASYIYK